MLIVSQCFIWNWYKSCKHVKCYRLSSCFIRHNTLCIDRFKFRIAHRPTVIWHWILILIFILNRIFLDFHADIFVLILILDFVINVQFEMQNCEPTQMKSASIKGIATMFDVTCTRKWSKINCLIHFNLLLCFQRWNDIRLNIHKSLTITSPINYPHTLKSANSKQSP